MFAICIPRTLKSSGWLSEALQRALAHVMATPIQLDHAGLHPPEPLKTFSDVC